MPEPVHATRRMAHSSWLRLGLWTKFWNTLEQGERHSSCLWDYHGPSVVWYPLRPKHLEVAKYRRGGTNPWEPTTCPNGLNNWQIHNYTGRFFNIPVVQTDILEEKNELHNLKLLFCIIHAKNAHSFQIGKDHWQKITANCCRTAKRILMNYKTQKSEKLEICNKEN